MAIAVSALTSSYNNANAAGYATASISPAAGSLLVLYVGSSITGGTAPGTTPTGLSLTWTLQDQIAFSGTGSAERRLAVFTAPCGASPGSGAVTLTHTDLGSGATSEGTAWAVLQVTGHNVAAPVVQHPKTSGVAATSGSLTLAAAASSLNRPVVGWWHRANEGKTPRTNWGELTDNFGGTPSVGLETQWRGDAFETTASATWVSSQPWAAIALEIASVQTITTLHIGPVSTRFGSTVVPGAVSVVANHLGPTSARLSPALAFTVATNHLGPTAALYQSTLIAGITAPLISTTVVHQPAVVPGQVTIATNHLGPTATALAQMVVPGLAALSTPLLGPVSVLYQSAVFGTISPPLISATALYQPAVGGSQGVVLPLLASGALYAPARALSVVALPVGAALWDNDSPVLWDDGTAVTWETTQLYAPVVATNVPLAPGHVGPTSVLYQPSVTPPAATQTVVANLLGPTSARFSPSLATGSVTVATNHLGPTSTRFSPAVAASTTTIVAAPVGVLTWEDGSLVEWEDGTPVLQETTSVHAPAVASSSGIVLNHLGPTSTKFSPAVSTSGITISANHRGPTAVIHSPAVVPGAAAVVLPLLSSGSRFSPALSSFLTTNLLGPTSTLPSPAVTQGAVTIGAVPVGTAQWDDGSAVLWDDGTAVTWQTTQVFVPAVSAAVAPPLLSTTFLYGPSVAPVGPIATLLIATTTVHQPGVGTDGQVATLHLGPTGIAYQPSVVPGSVSVGTNLIASTALYQPAAFAVIIGQAITTTALHAPAVSTLVAPSALTSGALYGPAVATGPVTVPAGHVGPVAALYQPTVTPGSVAAVLPSLTSGARYVPGVETFNTVELAPLAPTTFFPPTVSAGEVTVVVPAITSTVVRPPSAGALVLAAFRPSAATVYPPAVARVSVTVLDNIEAGAILSAWEAGALVLRWEAGALLLAEQAGLLTVGGT